jgi:hypothetical protein
MDIWIWALRLQVAAVALLGTLFGALGKALLLLLRRRQGEEDEDEEGGALRAVALASAAAAPAATLALWLCPARQVQGAIV